MRILPRLSILAAVLLAGCAEAPGARDAGRARPLSVSVGGSLDVTGAAVSQSRGPTAPLR